MEKITPDLDQEIGLALTTENENIERGFEKENTIIKNIRIKLIFKHEYQIIKKIKVKNY